MIPRSIRSDDLTVVSSKIGDNKVPTPYEEIQNFSSHFAHLFVPTGGGPPPHRHDFEEMFSILEGEIEVTFRGESITLKAGETANIPANAPHHFRNVSPHPARFLCLCSPAGVEDFFLSIGVPVQGRMTPAPEPGPGDQETSVNKAKALAAQFRTEFLHP